MKPIGINEEVLLLLDSDSRIDSPKKSEDQDGLLKLERVNELISNET